MVKERDLMKKWVKRFEKVYPSAFTYRIPDTPYAGYKPFDLFLLLHGTPWALEFKVNRRKIKPFRLQDEVTNHQMQNLKDFVQAGTDDRPTRAAVVVWEQKDDEWIFWEVAPYGSKQRTTLFE